MRDDLLKTYLDDHMAGSVTGAELAERFLESEREGPLRAFLSELVGEIREDQAVLRDVSSRLHGRENPAKKAAAWLLEKMSGLKPNKRLTGSSDLHQFEQLEALTLGVRGKLLLWQALEAVCASDGRFSDIPFRELQQRAQRQIDQLEHHRIEAARKVFSGKEKTRSSS